MRRLLAAAVALLIPAAVVALLVDPAVAGAQDATPVVGGGSFNTAPLIGPGAYRDTLLPGERLFYGIKLQAGQRLQVSGQLRASRKAVEDAATGFSVGIQTPLREVDVLDLVDHDIAGNGTVTTGSPTDRIAFVSVPVMTTSAARDEGIVYRGPGIWYVSLYLISQELHPPRVEIPVNLQLKVLGSPQPDPNPEKAPAAATPAPHGADAGGGTSVGTVVLVGVAALAVGAALGAAAAALTRRRRPA